MEKKHTKILVITKSVDGGTGTYVLQLLGLEKLVDNFRIKIISLEKPSFRKIDKYANKFVFYHDKNFYPQIYKFSLKNILNFIQELFWFKNQINRHNPDLVLSVDIHCNLLISISKFLFRQKDKLILTTHINLKDNIETRSDYILKKIFYKLIAFFYNKADRLIFVSNKLKCDFIKTFLIKKDVCATIYNGIDKIKIVDIPLGNIYKKTFITLARLVEQKDHQTLFRAFTSLLKKIPEARLLVLSRGREEIIIKALAKKFTLGRQIKFLGWVPNVSTYIKKSSIFVFSSKREGFGYALIEAMSQGLPVIATDTSFGPSEILDNGKYGILVLVGDEKAMSEAMYKLLTDEKKYDYYAQKSLERVKYFSLDKMLKAYKKLILEVLNK